MRPATGVDGARAHSPARSRGRATLAGTTPSDRLADGSESKSGYFYSVGGLTRKSKSGLIGSLVPARDDSCVHACGSGSSIPSHFVLPCARPPIAEESILINELLVAREEGAERGRRRTWEVIDKMPLRFDMRLSAIES